MGLRRRPRRRLARRGAQLPRLQRAAAHQQPRLRSNVEQRCCHCAALRAGTLPRGAGRGGRLLVGLYAAHQVRDAACAILCAAAVRYGVSSVHLYWAAACNLLQRPSAAHAASCNSYTCHTDHTNHCACPGRTCRYVAEADAGLFGGGGGSGLVAALMVSNPTCMEAFNANMAKPWSSNRLYNLALAHKLKEYLATHAATISTNSRIDLPVSLQPQLLASTFYLFMDAVQRTYSVFYRPLQCAEVFQRCASDLPRSYHSSMPSRPPAVLSPHTIVFKGIPTSDLTRASLRHSCRRACSANGP